MFAAKNLLIAGSAAPVIYDNAGSGYTLNTTTTSALGGSWSDTSPFGATVFVSVLCLSNAGGAHTAFTRTATYGGVSMTSFGAIDTNTGGNNGWLELFGLLGAGTATSQTVAFSISNASAKTFYAVAAGSSSYSNGYAFGSPVTNKGSGTSESSGTVSSAIGQKVIQAFGGFSIGPQVTQSSYNQTSRFTANPKNASPTSAIALNLGDAPGAATVSFTQSLSASSDWASIAVPFI